MYAVFLQWHLKQAVELGFDVETEVLRIPSSRNWAIVGKPSFRDWDWDAWVLTNVSGRRPTGQDETPYREKVLAMVDEVRRRGLFKTRVPEGGKKSGGH